tara:strand:+ start:324 stop:650 length:327 start_codon:yes stop_codon:yes gene_type:complete
MIKIMKSFIEFLSEVRAAKRRRGGPSEAEVLKDINQKEFQKGKLTPAQKHETEKRAREKTRIRITSKGIEGVSYMTGKDRGQDNRSPKQKATSVEGERMRRLNDRTQG